MIVKLIKLILGIKAGVNPQELLQWIKNRDPHFIERDFGSQQTELLLSKGSDFARYTLTTDSLQKKR